MYGRPGNPHSINQKLPALMNVRDNPNYRTREYVPKGEEFERPPFPYNRGQQGFGMRPECVAMKPVCRGNKYEYAGQAETTTQSKQPLRLKDYNIRPKNRVEAGYTGPRFRNKGPLASDITNYKIDRSDPCRTIKELGCGRPGGPILGLDGIGDAMHEDRMNDAVMRACPNKGTGMLSMDRRHPVANRTDAPQFQQDFPGNQIHKVSPEILRDIDPTLISAYKSNPYTQPILN